MNLKPWTKNNFSASSGKGSIWPWNKSYTNFNESLIGDNIFSLSDALYNNELRIMIDFNFKSPTGDCYLTIDDIKLNVTYGLDA